MVKSTVWVDIDETLLYSRFRTPNSIDFEFEGLPAFTAPRPSSWEFLAALEDDFELCVLTQGNVLFQEAALAACGLLDFFQGRVYGYLRDVNHTRLPETLPDRWLLVDNYSCRSPVLMDKRKWLNSQIEQGENFLKCDDWLGEYETEPLTALIPDIYKILCRI